MKDQQIKRPQLTAVGLSELESAIKLLRMTPLLSPTRIIYEQSFWEAYDAITSGDSR